VPGGELSEQADSQTIHPPAGDIREGYTMAESFFDMTFRRRIALLMLAILK